MTVVAEDRAERRLFLPVRWLFGARADLAFLVGSVAVSYALLFLWQGGVISTTTLVVIWIFGLHGPHFYGTMSRTYLDPTEWRERGPVLLRALGWFLVGPAMVGVGIAVERVTGYRDVVLVFFFLAALWAFQHVIKQHFGFVALYRAKHRQFDKRSFTFLKWYLIVSMWAPAVAVLVRALNWFEQIPFAMVWATGAGYERADQVTAAIADGALIVFWAAQAVFVARVALDVARGRALNLPVLLIVLASVPLTYLVAMACLDATAPGNFEAYAFVPLVTAYHNIQYHALIWTYNRHKYHALEPAEARARYGWAARLNRSIWIYALCGIAYTLVTIGIEQYQRYSIYDLFRIARDSHVGEVLAAAIWGFSFLHYYLDGHIWHVRSDANLRRVLGFPDPSSSA